MNLLAKSFVILPAWLFLTVSCKAPEKKLGLNSSEAEGLYQGVLPCADCEGIETSLEILKGNAYLLKQKYLGSSDSVYESSGEYVSIKPGKEIQLRPNSGSEVNYRFSLGENSALMLDQQGREVKGALAPLYRLEKVPEELRYQKWKLLELDAQKLDTNQERIKEAYIRFNFSGNRVSGSATCNRFFGNFQLGRDGGISFGNMGATKMYCLAIATEDLFFEILGKVDRYRIEGNTLYLMQGSRVRARFVSQSDQGSPNEAE